MTLHALRRTTADLIVLLAIVAGGVALCTVSAAPAAAVLRADGTCVPCPPPAATCPPPCAQPDNTIWG